MYYKYIETIGIFDTKISAQKICVKELEGE
jgi:hypothetical protein